MTTATASIVVVMLFGVLIGVLLQVVIQIIPQYRRLGKSTGAATGDRTVRGLVDQAIEQAEVSRTQAKAMPRSHQFAFASVYGLIGMLVLVIKLSPVTMRWGFFLGSIFGGFVLTDGIFWLARTHRIRLKSSTGKTVVATE